MSGGGGEEMQQETVHAFCYGKKVKMRISVLDKTELWCLHSDSVKRSLSQPP